MSLSSNVSQIWKTPSAGWFLIALVGFTMQRQ